MPSRKAREHLGDSWVVEGEDESSGGSPRHEREVEDDSPPPRMTPGRPTRSSNRSPAPEFVMPPLDPDTLEASWGDSTSRSTRFRRDRRPSEQGLESRRRSSRHTGSSGSPEKRPRTKTKDTYKPSSTITSAYLAPSSKGTSSYQREPSAVQDIVDVTVEHGATMLSWIIDILGGALRILKTPLSYLLAVWLLFGLIIMAHNLVTSSVYASLSPICRVPGVYYLNLPFCPVHSVDNANGPPPPVEFDQLMKVQAHFEEVLEESAGGVSLPLDMKRGEASIRDLRQLVRYSQLQSKNELVLEFDGFIETARIASYDLQKFNSHVGRAVDSVIATTKWTTRVLDGIQERDAGRGSINSFINDKLLAPFQPIKFTEGILLDQYIQHTHIVEEEINKLISEAQAMLMALNSLEDRLEVISNIAMRDDIHTKKLKEDILSELWTMVGGNRSKVNKMDRQLALLQQVSIYRKTAYAHVSGTIIRLQAIGAGLEDLRERVGSPELLRDRVHIPLSVHIENIQKGVERLEETRSNARKLENDQIRLTLERGQLEGTLIGTSSS